MPTCPHCGETFPQGGAYTTHVRHCDAQEATRGATDGGKKGENAGIRPRETDELARLEARLDRLEQAVASTPKRSDIQNVRETAEEARDAASRANRLTPDVIQEQPEWWGKIFQIMVVCANCGDLRLLGDAEGEACEACGRGEYARLLDVEVVEDD